VKIRSSPAFRRTCRHATVSPNRQLKLQEQDGKLEAEINTLALAVDSTTKDNRDKRKALQEKRNSLTKQIQLAAESHKEGQRVLANLYQSAEGSLALARHAESWEWKEVAPNPEDV
jgi:lipid II:glycine glycyltransferase (peptidoglycan interpeptide bridge formation enzyme)